MNINGRQAEILAQLIATIRPDWGRPSIVDALRKAYGINPNLEAVTAAALRAAATASNITPAVIGMSGPHWKAVPAGTEHRPPAHVPCGDCDFYHPNGTECPTAAVPPEQVESYTAECRRRINATRSYNPKGKHP